MVGAIYNLRCVSATGSIELTDTKAQKLISFEELIERLKNDFSQTHRVSVVRSETGKSIVVFTPMESNPIEEETPWLM